MPYPTNLLDHNHIKLSTLARTFDLPSIRTTLPHTDIQDVGRRCESIEPWTGSPHDVTHPPIREGAVGIEGDTRAVPQEQDVVLVVAMSDAYAEVVAMKLVS